MAACGSTAQTTSGVPGPGVGDGLGGPVSVSQDPGASAFPSVVPGASSPGGSSGASSVGATSRATNGAGSAAARTSGGDTSRALSGSGFDAKNVYVGVTTQNDTAQYSKALGGAGLDFGDYDAMLTAISRDINSRGGIGGRTLVLLRRDIKTGDSVNSSDATAQSVCSEFTQDRKVVAVVNPVANIDGDVLNECLSRAGVPLLSLGTRVVDAAYLGRFRSLVFKLLAPDARQWIPTFIRRLDAQGYFTPWDPNLQRAGTAKPVVGLLFRGEEPSRRSFQFLQSRVEGLGHPVVAFEYDANDPNAATSAVQGAVLKFQSSGVTHVINETAGDALVFSIAAKSQGYHPRYGLNSTIGPVVIAANSASELKGAKGVGWLPSLDVDVAQDPGPISPGDAACAAVMRKGGVDTRTRGADVVSTAFCDAFAILAGAIEAVDPTPVGVLRGLDAVARNFRPGVTWSGTVTQAGPFLPATARDLAFDDACTCLTYTSTTLHRLS